MTTRKLPPVWVMGMTNATYGMYGGFAVVTVAEMLAAQGLSGGRIAAIVSTILSPGVWIFLFAPMLDVRFRRRTYALVFASITALCVAAVVLNRTSVAVVEVCAIAGMIAVSQVQNAVGGWTGALIGKNADSRLGAWFAVGNTGAGGLMMLVGGETRHAYDAVACVREHGLHHDAAPVCCTSSFPRRCPMHGWARATASSSATSQSLRNGARCRSACCCSCCRPPRLR